MENEVLEEKNTNEVTINQDNDEKKKTPKTPKQKVIFGLKIAGNVLFYAVIIALFLFSIMNIRGGNGSDGFPNLFGKGMLTVETESMSHYNYKKEIDDKGNVYLTRLNKLSDEKWEGLPLSSGFDPNATNYSGDLLFADVFNPNDASKLKVGDVITFKDPSLKDALNTHRIVYINLKVDGTVDSFITEGDAQYYNQPFNQNDPKGSYNEALAFQGVTQTVTINQIRGVVTGVGFGAGGFIKNIRQNWIWYFVVPVGVVLAVELFLVVRNILAYRNEKNGKPSNLTEEEKELLRQEEKERLRQELLAELRAQGLAPKEELQTEPKVVENNTPVEDTPSLTEDKIEEKQEVETAEEISEDK